MISGKGEREGLPSPSMTIVRNYNPSSGWRRYMRIKKLVILLAAVWLVSPSTVEAAQSAYLSVDEFLMSLSIVAVPPQLGEWKIPTPIPQICTSTAGCSGSAPPATVSCSTTSGTCGAGVDQLCPLYPGYAECNGVRTYCAPCPPCNNIEACRAQCGDLFQCIGKSCLCA